MNDATAQALRLAAEKATPGPWVHYNEVFRPQFSQRRVNEIQRQDGQAVVCWGGFDGLRKTARKATDNAAYIALANPQTILELLAEREADKAEIGRLRGEIAYLKGATEEELAERRELETLARSYDPDAFVSGFSGDYRAREPRRIAAREKARAALSDSGRAGV